MVFEMVFHEGRHLIQSQKRHALLYVDMLDISFARLSATGDPYLDDKGTVVIHPSSPSLATVAGSSLMAG
jgi:hypothetical protein